VNYHLLRLACVATLVATGTYIPASADESKPPGNVIVARPAGNALLIWDASADVTAIVANKTSDADAKTLLERDAASALAASLSKVASDASSVTLRVIYQKSGAVSPVYGSATFAGVERYATLRLSGKDARSDRDRWREPAAGSPLPAWFAFDITGELPER
jgi:hypothetical protein